MKPRSYLINTHPHLEKEWHPTKNTKPFSEIGTASDRKVWWKGACGHEWEATPGNRTNTRPTGCPYCAGKKVAVGDNDLASTHPHLNAEWHLTKNTLTLHEVTAGSGKKLWWVCVKGHEWEARIDHRAKAERSSGCPYCSGSLPIPGETDLATLNPLLAKQWHPTKNSITPIQVTGNSGKKVWWLCGKGHEWEAKISSRHKGDGCPICSNKKLLPGYNDLATTNPSLAAEWHPTKNAPVTPSQVFSVARTKAWWQCKFGHEWEAAIYSRAAGRECPICSNKRTLQGHNDLVTTHPAIASQWDYEVNGDRKPEDYVAGSDVYVAWKCSNYGHKWNAYIYQRTAGRGCPICAKRESKAETTITEWLRETGIPVLTRTRGVISPQELDIYVPSKKIAIEYNGLYWHTEAQGKDSKYHYNKWLACKEKGIQLIQIWEDDWNRNPELVKSMLAHKLGVTKQTTVYARKTKVVDLTKTQVDEFLNANHIQGAVDGGIKIGLIDNTNTLVTVMILKSEAGSEGKSLNLLRYATSKHVIGGFTKLIKYVEATNPNVENILTFSDHTVSDGGLYANNGFTAAYQIPPDYMYVNPKIRIREHKFGYRLKRFRTDPALTYVEGLTEKELARLNGLDRIWDAGKTKWVKTVKR